jgi:hypothetical protein
MLSQRALTWPTQSHWLTYTLTDYHYSRKNLRHGLSSTLSTDFTTDKDNYEHPLSWPVVTRGKTVCVSKLIPASYYRKNINPVYQFWLIILNILSFYL